MDEKHRQELWHKQAPELVLRGVRIQVAKRRAIVCLRLHRPT